MSKSLLRSESSRETEQRRRVVSGNFCWAIAVVPQRGIGQDRVTVVPVAGGVVIVLAGGTGHGKVAAQAVIDAVTQGASSGRAGWSCWRSSIGMESSTGVASRPR